MKGVLHFNGISAEVKNTSIEIIDNSPKPRDLEWRDSVSVTVKGALTKEAVEEFENLVYCLPLNK